MSKKYWVVLATIVAVIIGWGLFASTASATMGDDTPDKCYETVVDQEAWTEPAVPDIPAIEEVSHVVQHPAVTEEIEHDAEFKTVHHPAEYELVIIPETFRTEYQWKWWGVKDHGKTVWTDGSYPTSVPNNKGGDWRKNGKTRDIPTGGGGSEWVKVKDEWYETVMVKEAWTEIVVIKEAWDETVVTQEYVPAVPGKPAVEHEATYKDVEVPCVVPPTEEPPVEEPPTDIPPTTDSPMDPPVVDEPVKTTSNEDVLPATGMSSNGFMLGGGIVALIAGFCALMAVRSKRLV